jgi:hypothetical protein
MVGTESPADERGPLSDPVVLNDNSLLYLDGAGTTLRRATPDGRVLWRIRLDVPAVAVLADRGSSLLVLRDGTFILVDVESATLGESWRVDATFSTAPLRIGNLLAFPSPTAEMLFIDSGRREIVSRLSDVPAFLDATFLPDQSLALVTADLHLLWQGSAGEVRTRTHLREPASFAALGEALLAYTRGGLWQIDRTGIWSLWREDAPAGGENSGLLVTTDRVFAFTGSRLLAYDLAGQPVWETATPVTRGSARIALLDDLLFVTTQHGDLLLITQDGRFCNQAKINGNAAARQWHQLGQDGLLRLLLADQILAIDFDLFTRPCRV